MNVSDCLAGHLQHRPYEGLLELPHHVSRLPTVYPLHRTLYGERLSRLTLWHLLLEVFYYEPTFKSRCERVGKNFELYAGIPLVMGAMRIRIGDDVKLSGLTTFVGSKMVDHPVLDIGSRTVIGHETGIYTGKGVYIGADVCIGNGVLIFGDDSHPLDALARAENAPPRQEDIQEVWVEDGVVVGHRAVVLKGVRVGTGAVILPGAVVTRDIAPHATVAGNPARVIQADMKIG